MANLRKRGIGKESIKVLEKPQLRWQREESWQMEVIIRKWQTLVEQGKFRQKWRVCQKFIKSLAKYSNEMTKRGFLTNGDFTQITNLAKIYLRFGKFKTRWQKRHVDNCGFYETGEFGKDWGNKTGILTVGNFHKNGKFEKVGNWARIHQRSGKIPNKVLDKEGNIDLRQISTKMAGVPKIHLGFGQIFKWDDKKGHGDNWRLGQSQILRRWRIWREVIYKEMTKRGILTNGDYNKNGKFCNNSFKVCRN